ncbi:MAG: ABC transporter ATP-binding protein [Methanosarcina sp.]|jgi:lipopolysaccharide transport system ATP-binding protein|nr:ABC transporter ATP-binding protein [Methanosarcina sp.]MDD4521499.1 ABC transporter ATP-binding protein [Methanosarcina sp.]
MAASKKEKPIIEVKHLSKQYNIGMDTTYKTFCESFTSAVRHPLKTLKDCRMPNDTFWALKDVNFEIEQGEIVGIIGRNGAGKSTLLKILSRITYPTEGEIIMRGRVGSLLEVGTGFHPELTGRENIYFNGAILGMKKREIDDKFDEIVKFSGVEKFLDTPVKRYSSGMQVRLAFSVAAHLEPEILLVDEVLAVGDAEFQKKCLGKMGEVAEEGRTVLFVSHELSSIQKLCNRCLLLDRGTTKLKGEPEKVIEYYMFQNKISGNKSITRKGNGKVQFENYYVGNKEKKQKNQFLMGDTIYVYFILNFRESIKNAEISLEIRDAFNNSIAHLSNEDDDFTFVGEKDHKYQFCVEIPNVYLTPTSYTISLWSGILNETFDHLRDCISIEIIQSDKVRRKTRYPSHLKYFLQSKWITQNEGDPINRQ